ncbi:MAG: hypothetical protein M3347_15135, partial [Armatimonadota bacterium]|nr:hypothetical protein [Armatimonadota bacterium]
MKHFPQIGLLACSILAPTLTWAAPQPNIQSNTPGAPTGVGASSAVLMLESSDEALERALTALTICRY